MRQGAWQGAETGRGRRGRGVRGLGENGKWSSTAGKKMPNAIPLLQTGGRKKEFLEKSCGGQTVHLISTSEHTPHPFSPHPPLDPPLLQHLTHIIVSMTALYKISAILHDNFILRQFFLSMTIFILNILSCENRKILRKKLNISEKLLSSLQNNSRNEYIEVAVLKYNHFETKILS